MKQCNSLELLLIFIIVFISSAQQMQLHPAVNICKRNDPNISDCYCQNVRTIIPILKDGIPKMHIPPLDPINVLNVIFDLSKLQPNLFANLYNLEVYGFSHAKIPYCYFAIEDTGTIHRLSLEVPLLRVQADCDIKGSFADFKLNSSGNFHAEFRRVYANTTWIGAKHRKHGREHFEFKCEFDDFEIKKIKLKFNNIFKNNPQMDKTLNDVIADNIDIIVSEAQPIALNIVKTIAVQLIDAIYATFPYDVLFPLE